MNSINHLENMNYDDLIDWIDYVEYHIILAHLDVDDDRKKHIRQRRKGKSTGSFPHGGFSTRPLKMITSDQVAALEVLQASNEETRQVIFTTAHAFKRARQPELARQRSNVKGSIQIKFRDVIHRTLNGEIIYDEEGNPKKTTFGPYLYLRVWATGGDADNRKRRLKSFYIGGGLEPGERIMGGYAYHHLALSLNDTYNMDTGRRKQTPETKTLMNLILDCIELHPTEPIIDYSRLDVLQGSL